VRLDKFLQVSRLIRRRALANSLCRAGRVTLNDRAAPPAAPVRPGDVVSVEVAGRRIRVRVRRVPDRGAPHGAEDCCEVLEDAGT